MTLTTETNVPMNIQIVKMCAEYGFNVQVCGSDFENHSLWTITSFDHGTICDQLLRPEAYWMLKGFLLSNPAKQVSNETMRLLEKAKLIERWDPFPHDWIEMITIGQAVAEIKEYNTKFEIKKIVGHDETTGEYFPTSEYIVQFKRK